MKKNIAVTDSMIQINIQNHCDIRNIFETRDRSSTDEPLVNLDVLKAASSNNHNQDAAISGALLNLNEDGLTHTYVTTSQDTKLAEQLPPVEQSNVISNGDLVKNTLSSFGDNSNISLSNNTSMLHHNINIHALNNKNIISAVHDAIEQSDVSGVAVSIPILLEI